MKRIPLKSEKYPNRVALVDDVDYDYLMQWDWRVDCKKGRNFYAISVEKVNGKPLKMHRAILGLTDPSTLGDHEDQDGLNNQRDNLRIATQTQNKANRRKRKNTSSKYMGVVKRGDKWIPTIYKDNVCVTLGYYDNEVTAAVVRDRAARFAYGEYASLNFPWFE